MNSERQQDTKHFKTLITIVTASGFLLTGLSGCGDQGAAISPTAPQTSNSFSVGLDTVFTFPQDTVQLIIRGGITPYSLLGPPPSAVARYGITDSTLTIISNSNGSSIASVVDAASPVHRFDLTIIVETAVSFTNSVQPVFTGPYGCVNCHGGTRGLYLTNATVSYQNLVNVPAQSPAFVGYKRVDPRNLLNSLLYIRLASNDPSISMPQGRTAPFDSSDLNYVRTWILQGAHFN